MDFPAKCIYIYVWRRAAFHVSVLKYFRRVAIILRQSQFFNFEVALDLGGHTDYQTLCLAFAFLRNQCAGEATGLPSCVWGPWWGVEPASGFFKFYFLYLFTDFKEREGGKEGGREKEKHRFVIRDWTCNRGVSGQCSNQLSYLARAAAGF